MHAMHRLHTMPTTILLMAATCLLVIGGCTHHEMKNATPDPVLCPGPYPFPLLDTRAVDLLFVVDNSGSMGDEQMRLKRQFPLLMHELRTMRGGLPDLHIGVTSTDLGAGMFQVAYCEQVGGDAGNLLTGSCTNPVGAPYIVDVTPQRCEIIREETSNTCLSHTCDQQSCAHEPSTTIVVDSQTGCPRCRNYTDESLEEVFSCMAELGTMGCGFEQPLEAMYKALDSSNRNNEGFLRDNAYLGVVLLTDEDDCSASNPELYDDQQTDMDSTLGPPTFRCFEHGITCDIDSRTHEGLRQYCVPREDADALVHPLSRYVQFLQALKDPRMIVLSAIAGPVQPSNSGDGDGFDITVGLDEQYDPEVQPSCSNPMGSAIPALRIHSLVSAFHPRPEVQDWAYTSVCGDSYATTLTGVGRKLAESLTLDCLDAPLRGCSDPGVEHGTPQAAQTCEVNAQCRAQCIVTTKYGRGTDYEAAFEVVPYLEVCADGPCPGNEDRTRSYANGHPGGLDQALPVLACWHIDFDERCINSKGARMVVSRRFTLPPRAFTIVSCKHLAPDEQLCNDGKDNDEDCLTDADDPCCQNPDYCVE